MTIATGSRSDWRIVAESTYGVTPANPAFLTMPYTSLAVGLTKDGLESQKLNRTRQIEDYRHGNRQVGGDIGAEFEFSSFDNVIEAVLMGSWASDVLTAGTTRRSFTGEKFLDLDADEYHRSTGLEFSRMSLSLSPNSMVQVTFGTIGKELDVSTSLISGSTYPTLSDNQPFDSFTGSILENGSPTAIISDLTLNIENGLEPAFVLFSNTTIQPSDGKSRLTLSMTAFFENSSLYQKFIDETESSITFTLVDPDGQSYEFDMPRVKFNAGNPDISGEGRVTLPLEVIALYDSVADSQITITRS